MEYRTWPALDARVSLLGFGCMRFPTDDAGCVQEDAAAAMLRRALEAGVNYIDTAYFYHEEQSERVLGRVLADVPRERYYLATKLPTWKVESLEDAQRFFTTQLERLNTDHFDFYLLHTLNRDRWRAMVELGVVDWCVQKQREGAICRFGFSFHDGYDAFEEILSFRKWDFCQIQFNYLDTDIQAGERGYALAEQLGVPLVIMEPVKGGALADLPEDLAARLRRARPGASMASWALRWAAGRANVLTVLSGMSTLEQVEDNAATFTRFQPLTQAELALVEETAAALRARVKNGCTGCRYCMPCPAGVNIPENFRLWNQTAKTQNGASAWRPWHVNFGEEDKAKNCVRCGRCVPLCPQGIPIPDDLARAQAELDAVPKP